MRAQHISRRQSGFTLTELVITMLIIGILAAAAAPRYVDALSHYRVEGATRRIVADLEFARNNAKTSGLSQSVTYAVGTESYSMSGISDPDHPTGTYLVQLAKTSYPADLTSVSLGPSGTLTTINFDMYGKPDYGGSIVLAVASHQRTITINGSTGKVTVTP